MEEYKSQYNYIAHITILLSFGFCDLTCTLLCVNNRKVRAGNKEKNRDSAGIVHINQILGNSGSVVRYKHGKRKNVQPA